MQNTSRIKFILSSLYAGIGLGLLLGLIMGLSISPTVKIVMGAFAGIIGGLLGLDRKLNKSETSEHHTMASNVKLGSFGLAMVLGILFGMTVRTNELLSPSINDRVNVWLDAGYDSIAARKYVAFEKLGIDPSSGEVLVSTGEIQKSNTSALFNASSQKDLSTLMDTAYFNGDMQKAISELKKENNPALDDMLLAASEIVSEKDQMQFLALIQQMTYKVEEKEQSYCTLSQNIIDWKGEALAKISALLIDVNYNQRNALVDKIKAFFCSIEKT